MKFICFGCVIGLLSACDFPSNDEGSVETSTACGASAFMQFIGKPVSLVRQQNLAGSTRYFGGDEVIPAASDPTRLNFVVSTGSIVEAALTPGATITRVFCG